MEYTVKALAELAGVTPRALRWYDRKGLLRPARTSAAGYRLYGGAEVDRLQAILFYKELGFGLDAIQAILDAPGFDRAAALRDHLAALEARRERLDSLILTVRKTIEEAEGGKKMTDQEKFEAFKRRSVEEKEARYGAEAREKYGDGPVDGANARFLALSREEYGERKALEEEILSALNAAVQAGADPAGKEGTRIAGLHRRWLEGCWEHYSPEAHQGLAELYTVDPRFTAYYDRSISGCAAFLRAAVLAHVK